MDLKNLSSCSKNYEEIEEKGVQKTATSHQILDMKSDCLKVDMERFSHYDNKDLTLGSRINLQRSPSKKGSQKRAEKKMNSNSLMDDVDGDITFMYTPKASLVAGNMPEKLMLANKNTDQIAPQAHHQITITTDVTTTTTTTTKPAGIPTKSSGFGKRSNSFKQSSIINPRRILFFFATLSSVGTMLLICLTLSMTKYIEDDNSHATKLI